MKRHFSKRPPQNQDRPAQPATQQPASGLNGVRRHKKSRIRLDGPAQGALGAQPSSAAEPKPSPEPSSFLSKLRQNKVAETSTEPPKSAKPTPVYESAPIFTKELVFNEPGKYTKEAEFEEFLDSVDPQVRSMLLLEAPPSQEWWDIDTGPSDKVLHPVLREPRWAAAQPVATTVYLTKEEKRRKRRNERQLRFAEARERVKSGIDPAPAPKISRANVMAVIGSSYLKDPTKYDQLALEAESKRHDDHLKANQDRHEASRATKWETQQQKILKHKQAGTHTAVFKTSDLSDGKQRFLLDYSAKKFLFTGTICIGIPTLIIVEGGEKEIQKYEKLLLNRINWQETNNSCSLVWKGQLANPLFQKWSVLELDPAETRRFLARFGCDGYWNLAQ